MAPKRAAKKAAVAPPPPPPPAAASSEETEDSRSRSEESEDEETHAVTSTPGTKNPPAPPQQKGEESGSSDEEEEEEEEEEPTRAAPTTAPKNAPPPPRQSEKSDSSDEEEEEEEESDEEPTRAAPTTGPKTAPPPPRQGEKSDSSDEEEEEEEEESDEEAPPTKPAPKKEAEELKPEAKKPASSFNRIWSTDDEVRILEALAAHRREHGALPQPDALVAALAGSLDNRAYGGKELQGKVKSLKHKYVTAAKKSELPSKEHDRRLFDLSKIVWGDVKTTAPAAEPRGFGEMCDMYPYLAEEVKELEMAHPGMFKREFGKMDDCKARALDVKIKKQRLLQMRVELRRSDLMKEVTKTFMDLVE